ncbi:MAG: sulfatase-like hydrolase/transferase [Armatimonadaceae bacterium]
MMKRPPNILFFFPDQHRYDWTGFDIPAVRTPNLAALAARGTRFRECVVPSPLCAPCRSCLAQGVEYDRCQTPDNAANMPLDTPNFYRLLRDAAGYDVYGVGKFDLNKGSNGRGDGQGLDGKNMLPEWGFTDGINNAGKWDAMRGAESPRDPFMHFLQERGLLATHAADMNSRRGEHRNFLNTAPSPLPEDAYCDNWLAENGREFLHNAATDTPWFLVVNFVGPHEPVDITARMEASVRDRVLPPPTGSTQYDAATHQAIRQNYTAMVENIDRWLGEYVQLLQERGEWENTVIVYSSDHGEMLGDNNLWTKKLPHHPSIAVPLIAAGPGIQPGKTSDALVSLMDLASTFLDIAGVETPETMQSRSVLPLLQGTTQTHRSHVYSGLGNWRSVYDGRYKLITGYTSSKESMPETLLFDRQTDPAEQINRHGTLPEVEERLQRLLYKNSV